MVIQGGRAADARGEIRFVNDFDMSPVKRFYIIKNIDTDLIRGWRAHRLEQRWFYVLSGSFSIDIVKIDNWNITSRDLFIETKTLTKESMQVLHIQSGFATAIQALEENSELLVFGDYEIEHASSDNYVYPLDYFVHKK